MIRKLNRWLCNEPWCFDPDRVKTWTLERMKALFFGPEAEDERRVAMGKPARNQSAAEGLTRAELARRLFWQTGKKRGYSEARIQRDWDDWGRARHWGGHGRATRTDERPAGPGTHPTVDANQRTEQTPQ